MIKKRRKKPKNKETKSYQNWELRNLKKKCLKLWSQIVKIRAGWVCEFTGSKEKLQSHHIEDFRLCPALRYDPRNGICCSVGAHKFSPNSVHHSFIFLYDYMTSKRVDDIAYLRAHRNDKIEFTKDKILDIIKTLEEGGEDKCIIS